MGQGVFGCDGVCGWNWEGEVSEAGGDMSGDGLEDQWGLCFSKETGGEILVGFGGSLLSCLFW